MAKVEVDVRSSRIPQNLTGGLSRAVVEIRTHERLDPCGNPPTYQSFHSPMGLAALRSRGTGDLVLNR